MAQRHTSGSLRRSAQRYGIVGSRQVLGALVALACLAGAAGMAWRSHDGGFALERSGGVPAENTLSQEETLEAPAEVSEASDQDVRCVVHVDGAVASPGVVELYGADLRVCDAVDAAGGLLADADTSAVNLAETLRDGAKIHIPRAGEAQWVPGTTGVGQTQSVGAAESGAQDGLVNINTATPGELQSLSGVGEVTARAIVEERERNGPFTSPEDLMRVTGIGEKRFEKVRDRICV